MNSLTPEETLALQRIALNIRKKVLHQIKVGGSGHLGGALSMVEILTTLYFRTMRVDPNRPDWEARDRFVLSAGHKCLALYAALAERGFFDPSILDTYGSLNSRLPGHPDLHKLPGLEASTGALGHGLSIATGMALGVRMSGLDARVYALLGDGELAEGSNWEAAAAASHYHLDNLVAFVDRNGLQMEGRTVDVMSYEPLTARWEAFGWRARLIDGHDFDQIATCLAETPFEQGMPSVIVANTVKAKGISFAEDDFRYHAWRATPEGLAQAEEDLATIERSLQP